MSLNFANKPCETITSKIYSTVQSFANSEILVDQRKYYNNGFGKRYDLSFDEDDEEFMLGRNLNMRDKENKISNEPDNQDACQDLIKEGDFDPDDEELAEWKPSDNPKSYRVSLQIFLFEVRL